MTQWLAQTRDRVSSMLFECSTAKLVALLKEITNYSLETPRLKIKFSARSTSEPSQYGK